MGVLEKAQSVIPTGGITAYAFSVTQGSLPAGMTLCAFSSTPTQAQNYSFSVKFTGSAQIAGQTAAAARSINIAP